MVNIKKELHISNCGLDHDNADSLVCSQWQSKSNSNAYLIYRWLFATFATIIFIISFYGFAIKFGDLNVPLGRYFIFLTHWGLIINMIVGIYGALLVTVWHFHDEYRDNIQRKETTPTLFKIYWAIHNCALETSLLITIFYWTILHPHINAPADMPNILSHAMNSVLMFLDLLVIAFPMRLYHVIHPICFGYCYTIFSFIYYLCGGLGLGDTHYIYAPLDWEEPKKAFTTVAGVLVLFIFIHTVLFWIYKLRVFIQRQLFCEQLDFPYKQEQP